MIGQKTVVKKKITCFLKNYVASLFTFFKKVHANHIEMDLESINQKFFFLFLKGALSGLRQFLAIERLLKMMRNAFYFTSKALFVLKTFKFLS